MQSVTSSPIATTSEDQEIPVSGSVTDVLVDGVVTPFPSAEEESGGMGTALQITYNVALNVPGGVSSVRNYRPTNSRPIRRIIPHRPGTTVYGTLRGDFVNLRFDEYRAEASCGPRSPGTPPPPPPPTNPTSPIDPNTGQPIAPPDTGT